jgi:hypothetical protein
VQTLSNSTIQLGGETSRWVARVPSDIEGKTNPVLTLRPDERYEVIWENVDGAPHNFAIEDDEGEPVVESEISSGEGETQTVEFTASEEMSAYLCQVHPDTMRGELEVTDDEPAEGLERPAFERQVFEEERGDVARFTFSLVNAEAVEMVVGSEALNYRVSFTAVDGDDDGEVTVAFDTFAAGRGTDADVTAVADDDGIGEFRRETEPLSAPLDVDVYPIQASIGGTPADSAVLVLHPRETRAAHAAVAPGPSLPGDDEAFFSAVSRREAVATGDWAVLEVEASGLYATLDSRKAFADESLGYELSVERTGVVNAEPESVSLEDVHVAVDEAEDRFFAAGDSSSLRTDATYEASFAITDASPYVPADEREEVASAVTVVKRRATFDAESGDLTVPASETTLSGQTTVAPGTIVIVTVAGTGDDGFRRSAYATVEDDGSWAVSFDFSDLDPGATFVARVIGLGGEVQGEVTDSG